MVRSQVDITYDCSPHWRSRIGTFARARTDAHHWATFFFQSIMFSVAG
jgi:hypothetical protein